MKTFIALLSLLALIGPCAKISFASEGGFTGYDWDKFSKPTKGILMTGYTMGFYSGTIHGASAGIYSVAQFFRERKDIELPTANNKSEKIYKEAEKYAEAIDLNRNTILKPILDYKPLDSKSGEYYADEIDSFYKQFPLCKGRDFYLMLIQISTVWNKITDYKTVGDSCLKND